MAETYKKIFEIELVTKSQGKIDDSVQKLIYYRKELNAVREQVKKLNEAEEKYGDSARRKNHPVRAQLIKLEEEYKQKISESQRQIREYTKLQQAQAGSMKEQSLILGQYRDAWRKLNEEQKKSKGGQELLKRINALDASLKKSDASIGNYQRNVGNYGEALSGLKGIFGAVGAAVAGAVTAFNAFQGIMSSTWGTSRDLDIAVAGLNAEFSLLKKSLATLDFSLFLNNAADARKAAEELAKELNHAFGRFNSLTLMEAEASKELEELRTDIGDATLSPEKRIAAQEKYNEIVKSLAKQRADIYKDEADKRLEVLASTSKLNKEQLEEFIKEYNLNEDKIRQAYEYIDALNKVESASSKVRSTGAGPLTFSYNSNQETGDITEARKVVAQASDDTKKLAENLKKLQINDKEAISGFVEARRNQWQAEAEGTRTTREANNQANSLRKQMADEEKAAADKRQKNAEDAAKKYQDTIKKNNELILALNRSLLDAEIGQMTEGVEKQLAAQDAAQKKRLEDLEKSYQEQRAANNKFNDENKKLHVSNEELDKAYQNAAEAIEKDGAKKRLDILRNLNDEKFKEYQDSLTDQKKIEEAGVVAFERAEKKKTEAYKREQAERVSRAQSTDTSINTAEADYRVEAERIAMLSVSEDERAKLNLQNEKKLAQAKANAYMAELKYLASTGDISSDRYQWLLSQLKNMIDEIDKLGGEGGDKKGSPAAKWLAKALGVDEESAEEIINAAFDIANQVADILVDSKRQSVERELELEHKRIDDEAESKKKALEDQRDKGIISEKKYQKELEKVDKNADARRQEAERKAFEEKKRLDVKSALINTALSITKTFATYGWPAGIIPAAIAAATGAVQVAAIQSQRYAKGGILVGKSHAEGGIKGHINGNPIEVEGGEVVINKRSAALFRNQLSAINSYNGYGRKFAEGGMFDGSMFAPAPIPASSPRQQAVSRQEVEAIVNTAVRNIRVYVVESDITEAQESVKRVEVMSNF